ncbi:olfactory receptor 13C4-like [Pholidichthys leucotaenia]
MHLDISRYLYFMVTLMLYTAIIIANISLVAVICMNRSLHEPMYMFLCSLLVNELYGSTGLFPFLLIQILSDVHSISVIFCYLQIFCLYSYAYLELYNLAIMSYDRYLAICSPLQYNSHMTHKVIMLVTVIWLFAFVRCFINTCINMHLTLCGNHINSLYCQNYHIMKLACSDTKLNNISGLLGLLPAIVLPMLSILYSYMKILKICFAGSKQMRQRTVNTCAPHLASLLNFSFGCLFEMLLSRFDASSLPSISRNLISLYFGILQPLMNPIMFGMQMSKLRKAVIVFCLTLKCKVF